jgi:hypothetical protein
MSDINDLSQPLTGSSNAGGEGGGDDTASQGSQRSSASLLERIRAQRAQQQQQSNTTPTSIQVPQYNPVAQQENFAGGGPAPPTNTGDSSNNFFSSAWNNISESLETGMASLQQEVSFEPPDQALLAPSSSTMVHGEENYSMGAYFMTFVNDVYGTFLRLPLLLRVVMIFALLFTAFKLW